MTRTVCVVTGSRAEYGYLYWPMRLIRDCPQLELRLVVTGMHLGPVFGNTWRDIERDGFTIDKRVRSVARVDDAVAAVRSGVRGDDAVAVVRSIGRGTLGFPAVLKELAPDFLMLFGDRYEMLPAAIAALVAGIPVAHLGGGDVSEGAFDESIRHALTKMSHLHFVTNHEAARRVARMGEDPANIHCVGSTSLDFVKRMTFMPRDEVFAAIGLAPRARNLLVTFHPVTLDRRSSVDQLEELLAALDELGPAVGIVLTGPNADPEGRAMAVRLAEFAALREHVVFRVSLGHSLYLNALNQVDACVGNSSSGLYEAPSFGIPTVNIGARQKGRLRADSVIDCAPERDAIARAIAAALERDCSGTVNPYGDGEASPRIVSILAGIEDPKALLGKRFHDA